MKIFLSIALAAVFFAFNGHAIAQDIPAPTPSGIDNFAGLVVVSVPDYEGSDDSTAAIGPILKFKFQGQRYFQVLGNNADLNIFSKSKTWEFGPMGVYRGAAIAVTSMMPLSRYSREFVTASGLSALVNNFAAKLKIEQGGTFYGGHRPLGRPRTACPLLQLALQYPL